MAKKSAFDWKLSDIQKAGNVLPLMANEAKNMFIGNFRRQGFLDTVNEPWQEVQRRISGTKAYKYPKGNGLSRRTSNILVRKGTLRKGVRYQYRGKYVIAVVNTVPYAPYQNDGTKNIPQRKFIGHSQVLNKKLINIIIKSKNKAFK